MLVDMVFMNAAVFSNDLEYFYSFKLNDTSETMKKIKFTIEDVIVCLNFQATISMS